MIRSTLRRILTGDHDETVGTERAIARTVPAPLTVEQIRKGLAGEL